MLVDNFILQSTNAPGTGATCLLIAPPAGRIAFSAKFGNGANVFYCLDDGTQAEWGVGLLTTGSPDTITRSTVIGNTLNTTARLNFSGLTRIYNEVPAENLIFRDQTSTIQTGIIMATEPGTGIQTIGISSPSSPSGANLALFGNGTTTPNKYLRAINGVFQVVNSAYTAAPLTLTDSGTLSITGGLNATSVNVQVSGQGSAQVSVGGAANTGYLGLFNLSGVRQGYVGYGASGGPLLLAVDGSPGTATGWSTNANFNVGGTLTAGATSTTTATITGVATAGTLNATSGTIGALAATNLALGNNLWVGGALHVVGPTSLAGALTAQSIAGTSLDAVNANVTANGGRVRASYGTRTGPAVQGVGQLDLNTCPILADFSWNPSQNGYLVLPMGLILQWGQVTVPNTGGYATFGLNMAYTVTYSINISFLGKSEGSCAASPMSLTQFQALLSSSSAPRVCSWFAIGM